MLRRWPLLCLIVGFLGGLNPSYAQPKPDPGSIPPVKQAFVIPVQGQVAKPTLFILRRGLKEAIERDADTVILEIDTPGGDGAVTLEMMEALQRFEGTTIAFVNDEAMSAGAFIAAATTEIIMAPRSVIGAAAPVSASGQEIDETMKAKIMSYFLGKVRAVAEGKGYRAQVISAMVDKEYELRIGDAIVHPKGSLLTLTATEAVQTYGEPPQPLLATGVFTSVEELLKARLGGDKFEVINYKLTWSEHLAQYLTAITPVLMGIGMLCLFIEFKTPGFGIIGMVGISLLAVVFLSNFVAGLSGHEPILVFFLGLSLLIVEIIFFPGIALLALTGVVFMLGSLVWAMADIWPNEPVTFSSDLFLRPLWNLLGAGVVAIGLGALLARFLPRTLFWDRMVLSASIDATAQRDVASAASGVLLSSLVGCLGKTITPLFPSGEVEIDGRRYQARVVVGHLEQGQVIVVKDHNEFGLLVDKAP